MKKPLIVTLCVCACVYIKGCSYFFILMSRWSIQRIKASNALCVVYTVYVDTVNTKIKAHNALNAVYVDTINTRVCGFYTTLYTV